MSKRDDAVVAIGEVAKNHQFTLMQDSWHYTDSNFDFAWSKEVVKELASKDVKHYIAEYPSYFQPIINGYDRGEYTKEEAIENFSNFWAQQSEGDRLRTAGNFVDLLDAAKENHIQVHAIDHHGPYTSLLCADSVKAQNVKTIGDLKHVYFIQRFLSFAKQTIAKPITTLIFLKF